MATTGAWALGVALVYAPAAIGGLMYAVVGSTVTLVWAPSGIALAALLLRGPGMSLGVLVGAFVANAWTGVPLAVASGVALGNTLAALLGWWTLTRLNDFHAGLQRRSDVLAFMGFAAVGSTLVSAVVGATVLWAAGLLIAHDWASTMVKWWLGDMMGVLVVAPALLVWARGRWPVGSSARVIEALLLTALILVTSRLIFGESELAGHGYYPAALGVFPFVIWGALRFGQRGSTLITLGISLLAVVGTTLGQGPFAVEQPVDSLVRWCAFAIVVAVTGLLLAASVAEQRQAQAALRRSLAELDRQVHERTRDLSEANSALQREMEERRLLENELLRLGEAQLQAMGRELHDGLGQHMTSLALHCASLQQQLAERDLPQAGTAARVVDLANEANRMTRHMARGLYPVALEFGGLVAALKRLAEETHALGHMTCLCRAREDAQVQDNMVAINLYRIAQEAVNNAVKYSRASCVRIELERAGRQVCLSISDDGIGMDFDRTSPQAGMGLHSMRYRARLLGGSLAIEPLPLGGTRVVVTVNANEGTVQP